MGPREEEGLVGWESFRRARRHTTRALYADTARQKYIQPLLDIRVAREISFSVLSTFSECFSPLIDAEKLSLDENYDRIRHRNIIP